MQITSIRVLITLATIYNLYVYQMYVKTIYIKVNLDVGMHMSQLESYVVPGTEQKDVQNG